VSGNEEWSERPLDGAEEVGGAQHEREGDEVAHEDAGQQHERQLAAAGAHHRRAPARRPHAAHQPAPTPHTPHSHIIIMRHRHSIDFVKIIQMTKKSVSQKYVSLCRFVLLHADIKEHYRANGALTTLVNF
jgi:hypothetical protein